MCYVKVMRNRNSTKTNELYPLGIDKDLVTTSEVEQFKLQLKVWMHEALHDGWTYKPLHSSNDSAWKLTKGEWVAHVITRDSHLSLHVWRDFGGSAVLNVPLTYSMETLETCSRVCQWCSKSFDKLHRVGFANKVCSTCLTRAKTELEFPGWCD